MKRSPGIAILVMSVAVSISGCDSAAVGDRDLAFADYYPLMTDQERVDFGSLRLVEERRDFVREHGLDIQLMLNRKLRNGMDMDAVEGVLGKPYNVESHRTPHGPRAGEQVAWFYRSFEGVSRPIIYSVRFHEGAVEGWDAWREQ